MPFHPPDKELAQCHDEDMELLMSWEPIVSLEMFIAAGFRQTKRIRIGPAPLLLNFHHPAVKIWSNHEDALAAYHNAMLYECMYRGYINNMLELPPSCDYKIPLFIRDKKFHDSHKSNLLKKDFKYSSQFGWSVDLNFPYYWPVNS
jgi:hypothetical protein